MVVLTHPPPPDACFALAAVETTGLIQMTNNPWCFSRHDLMSRFGFRRLHFINDFAAVARSLPQLQARQLHPLTRDLATDPTDLLTIGPGTGLGGARLIGGEQVIACEPGQAGLSPATAEELEIFRLLQPQWGEIYAELLLSGPGLERLYRALATIGDEPARSLKAADIGALAAAGEDPLCEQTLEVFCALLGSAAGDFTVSTGSCGGVYLAGGIVPRLIPLLEQSDFLARFVRKAAMEQRLRTVPVHIIVDQHPGLLGAAAWPLEH